MLPVGTAVKVLGENKRMIRTGSIAGPLTRVQYTAGQPSYAYPVELDKGFHSTDGFSFIKIMLVNPYSLDSGAAFPCHHCGCDMGSKRPSGVCSSTCLNQAQGFTA
jgi:hypothetical protein